jgi:hypothetical protein
MGSWELILRLGFGKTNDALAVLELTTLAQKVDTLETFQHTAFGLDGAAAFQTGMLAHKIKRVVEDAGGCLENQSHSGKKIPRVRIIF